MKILSNEVSQHYQIASLKRGHSVFTSFISKNGKILFLDAHLGRLLSGADFLFPHVNWTRHFADLKQYVESEFSSCREQRKKYGYFRLTIFDDSVHLELHDLMESIETVNLTTAQKMKTPGLTPSFLKLPDYVEADLELIAAKTRHFDDVAFFDHRAKLTEASSSNIFVVALDGRIMTPAPSSMVLDGILRKNLFNHLTKNKFEVLEMELSKSDLLNAKEIWLTNSVRGIRFVKQFENVFFEMNNSSFESVLKSFGRYGEYV